MAEKLTFKSKTKVQEYAVKLGYDMGSSKLNTTLSIKLNGIPKKDGAWMQADIDNLLLYGKFKKLAGAVSGDVAELDRKIKEEELLTKKADRKKKEIQTAILEGKTIPLDDAEIKHSAKLQFFISATEGFFMAKAAAMVEKCGGDMEKVAELRQFCLDEWAEYLDEYSRPCVYNIPLATMKGVETED